MERVCNTAKLAVQKRAQDADGEDDRRIAYAVRTLIFDMLVELLWYFKMWTKNPSNPDFKRAAVRERIVRLASRLGVAEHLAKNSRMDICIYTAAHFQPVFNLCQQLTLAFLPGAKWDDYWPVAQAYYNARDALDPRDMLMEFVAVYVGLLHYIDKCNDKVYSINKWSRDEIAEPEPAPVEPMHVRGAPRPREVATEEDIALVRSCVHIVAHHPDKKLYFPFLIRKLRRGDNDEQHVYVGLVGARIKQQGVMTEQQWLALINTVGRTYEGMLIGEPGATAHYPGDHERATVLLIRKALIPAEDRDDVSVEAGSDDEADAAAAAIAAAAV